MCWSSHSEYESVVIARQKVAVGIEPRPPKQDVWFLILQIIPIDEQGPPEYQAVQPGRVQQESIKFELQEGVQGLRCVKKYQMGEIAWSQTTVMGDFDQGTSPRRCSCQQNQPLLGIR